MAAPGTEEEPESKKGEYESDLVFKKYFVLWSEFRSLACHLQLYWRSGVYINVGVWSGA